MKKIIFVLLLIPFTIRAQIITTVAGSGPYIYSGDGGLATLATLDPQCVFVDGSENIYIADNYNSSLHLVNSAGIIRTIAGTEVGGFSGDGGPATAAMMYNALAVTLDATGNIFVVDQTNQRIRRINTAGIISTFAGNGFGALTGSGGFSGDGGQATAAELNNPYGVAVDASGGDEIKSMVAFRQSLVLYEKELEIISKGFDSIRKDASTNASNAFMDTWGKEREVIKVIDNILIGEVLIDSLSGNELSESLEKKLSESSGYSSIRYSNNHGIVPMYKNKSKQEIIESFISRQGLIRMGGSCYQKL